MKQFFVLRSFSLVHNHPQGFCGMPAAREFGVFWIIRSSQIVVNDIVHEIEFRILMIVHYSPNTTGNQCFQFGKSESSPLMSMYPSGMPV